MRLKIEWLLACIAVTAAVLFTAPPEAGAQVFATDWAVVVGETNVSGSFTTNIQAGEIDVRQGTGLALFLKAACTNASGSNVVVQLDASYDGTNWSTHCPGLCWTLPNSGTTAFVGYTNFPPEALNNFRKVRIGTVQNVHLSTLFITNIVRSYSNSAP